jgi:cation diffusion facilitator family transporter
MLHQHLIGGNKARELAARVMWLVLGINLLAAAVKLTIGLLSHSTVVRGDAYYTAIDALVDVMLLVFVRFSGKPPDARHPYGHAKFEAVAVAVVSVLIFAMLQDLGKHAWHAFKGESAPHYDPVYLLVLGLTLAGSAALAVYEVRMSRRLNNASLHADAYFTIGGCVLTALSILSLLGARSGLSWPDGVGAMLACLLILWAGWEVARDALASLTDEARLDEALVRETTLGVAGARDCHQIRSRGTRDQVHVDLHVQVDPRMTTLESHALAHSVEDVIMERFSSVVEVTVHIEPMRENGEMQSGPRDGL